GRRPSARCLGTVPVPRAHSTLFIAARIHSVYCLDSLRVGSDLVFDPVTASRRAEGVTPIDNTQTRAGASDEANRANSSPLPSPSLPKGGGGIRGLGEKFGVNPVTGTGSL